MSGEGKLSNEARFWTITAIVISLISLLVAYQQLTESRQPTTKSAKASTTDVK